VGWINLIWDRDKYCGVVNVVMNFGFRKMWEFVDWVRN
jgi:hypothetical protein